MSNIQIHRDSFNQYNTDNQLIGEILSNGSGGTYSSPNYNTTDYLPLTDSTYTISMIRETSALTLRCNVYNANKGFISTIVNVNNPDSGAYSNTFNIPSNATYIRISTQKNDTNVMLNVGITPLPYEPYGVQWHDLQPQIRANSTWTDSADNPKKYDGGWT